MDLDAKNGKRERERETYLGLKNSRLKLRLYRSSDIVQNSNKIWTFISRENCERTGNICHVECFSV